MSAAQGHVSGLAVGGAAGLFSCGLAPQLDLRPSLGFDAFPTTKLRLPLSASPLPPLTLMGAHCRPGYSSSYRNGRFSAGSRSHSRLPRWPWARSASMTNPPLRPGTHCFLFCAPYLPRLSSLFVFEREMDVLGWHMYILSIWIPSRQEEGEKIK